MTPDRPHPRGSMRSLPSERRARPAGEWNHYRITANNGTIKLAVNGGEVSGGYDISPRKGYIHLESEGGEVLYRNLRLKTLPPAGTLAPGQIAQADEGFVSLYTGIDFRGWQYPKGHEGHWVSKDWIIAYDGKSAATQKDLSSEKSFADAVLIGDWRRGNVPGTDRLPVGFEGLDLPDDIRAAVARVLSSGKPGEWHRAMLTRQKGRLKGAIDVTLLIDGEPVFFHVSVRGAPSRSRIVLPHDGQPIEFANIFVKRLD
jgi:hypothetical protein